MANVSGAGVTTQATALSTFIVTIESSKNIPSYGGGGGGITGDVLDSIVCPVPYMRYAKECCLDSNNNSICDMDDVSIVNNISINKSQGENVSNTNLGDEKFEKSFVELIKNFYSSFSILVKSLLESNYFWYFVFILILFIVLRIFRFEYLLQKIHNFVIILLFRKKKNPNLISNIPGIIVYSSTGMEVGRVADVYLDYETRRISGWLINVNSDVERNIGKRFILVKPESVSSIGDVMVLGAALEDFLFERTADEILEDVY